MAAALRRWATSMMRKPQSSRPFPRSIYPTMLEKVEGIKKLGAPTEDASMVLARIEDKLNTFHMFWEANERQVQGLMRNSTRCRLHVAFVTVASAAGLVKGAHLAYKSVAV